MKRNVFINYLVDESQLSFPPLPTSSHSSSAVIDVKKRKSSWSHRSFRQKFCDKNHRKSMAILSIASDVFTVENN